jgi:hypothetical protein
VSKVHFDIHRTVAEFASLFDGVDGFAVDRDRDPLHPRPGVFGIPVGRVDVEREFGRAFIQAFGQRPAQFDARRGRVFEGHQMPDRAFAGAPGVGSHDLEEVFAARFETGEDFVEQQAVGPSPAESSGVLFGSE